MSLILAQQKYFAHWLTRSLPYDRIRKLPASLQNAQVDLTLRQFDATIIALKSTFSKSTILADNLADVEVDSKKETLLSKVEAMLDQRITQSKLVTFHWRII